VNTPAQLTASRLLWWCLGAAALLQFLLWRWGEIEQFTPIFRYLLAAHDTHGNVLLGVLAVCAYLLRRRPQAIAAARAAADHPWAFAAVMFVFSCAGSLVAYHGYPLSMDEYAHLFQARVFAAGRLSGEFPPDLMDRLVPPYFQNGFISVSHASGQVAGNYWPGFSLLLAPFAWLGVPWAANPLLGALAIPVIHRLAWHATRSPEAAGWAVLLAVASPVFVVSSISFYSMQAHLFANASYALLLLQPTAPRVLLAGLVGSLALTLHQPVPHFLFALPFVLWLAFRRGGVRILAALAAGYLPLSLVLGLGWYQYIFDLMHGAATQAAAAAPLEAIVARIAGVMSLPGPVTLEVRLAGLAKVWTWAAPGLLVLAGFGFAAARGSSAARLLGAALVVTFFGFFLFRVEHGHGWGYRYLHSAWFVLPVLAAAALAAPHEGGKGELRSMAAWAVVLSLVIGNGQRLVQVEAFIGRHLAQVPPLARAPAAGLHELVFVNPGGGAYLEDLVQNDPFLRGPRIVMTTEGRESPADLARRRFPGHERAAQGPWGELWTAPR
jgi:hypothetical protein